MREKSKIPIIIFVLLILSSSLALASKPKQGGVYTITTDGICPGGNPSTNGVNYDLIYSIPQPGGIGISAGDKTVLESGYISQLYISSPPIFLNSPEITNLSPAWGVNDGIVNIIISGKDLSATDSVKLVRQGFPDIVASKVVIIQSDIISCNFDIKNQAYGLWDVVTTNTIGQLGRLSKAFSICLPLIYDDSGGNAVGSDGRTRIDVSPHTFGTDVYVVIDSEPEYDGATQLDNSGSGMLQIADTITEIKVYNVFSELIEGYLSREVTVILPYKDMDLDGIVDDISPLINERNLRVGRLVDSKWKLIDHSYVDTEKDTVSAEVNHLSYFALLGSSRHGADIDEAHPYPVPFRSYRHDRIIFTLLPDRAEINIYDIAGDLVAKLKEDDTDGEFAWDVTDDDGHNVCSGVYIYVIKDRHGGKKKGRLVIIR